MSYEAARSLMNRGLSRPSLYKVSIDRNNNNAGFSDEARDYMEFFCSSASIPQINHETMPVAGQDMVGVMRQQPAQVVYAKPFQIEVIERSDYVMYEQLKKWFDYTANGSNSTNEMSHRMKYYDDIVCDIQLRKFEYSQHASPTSKMAADVARDLQREGHFNKWGYRTALKVDFRNAFPVSIGDIQYNSESTSQMVRYNVSFTYETYSTIVPDYFGAEHLSDFDQSIRDFLGTNG